MLSKILNYYFELKYTLFVYQEIALKLKTNAKIPELKFFENLQRVYAMI
jgi:hypothetical protein